MARASFGLDRVIIERRSIAHSRPFVCYLSKPPSVNEMFGQAPGRKRFISKVYGQWIEESLQVFMCLKPPRYPGQVWLSFTYEDAGQADLDNLCKAIPDILKKANVIVDDSRKYVRGIKLLWGNNRGVKIEIQPYAFDERAAA